MTQKWNNKNLVLELLKRRLSFLFFNFSGTNSIAKFLFLHFGVTNSSLKIILQVTNLKNKEGNITLTL